METNRIRAEILAERWTREITIFLGLFVVFGVVQAFDSELKSIGQMLHLIANHDTLNQAWPKLLASLLLFGGLLLYIRIRSK